VALLIMVALTWRFDAMGFSNLGGERQDPAKPKLSPLYVGVSECARCHEEPTHIKGAPVLCRCNEVAIWNAHDKHKQAYNVLLEERARQMGKLLGIANVHEEKSCLKCHAVVMDDAILKKSKTVAFAMRDGVSCVVCHGAYAEWVDVHGGVRREEWR